MKKRWKVLCCALLAGSLCACGSAGDEGEDREVTLILDYVPNTNHTGIYVAQEKGYFEEEGITLNIVEPGNDQTSRYAGRRRTRRVRRILSGRCDVCENGGGSAADPRDRHGHQAQHFRLRQRRIQGHQQPGRL